MQYLGTCMRRKSIIILTLILITILGLTIFTACGNEDTKNQFVVNEKGELVAYNGTATKITIPSSVKKIGVLAFYQNTKIKSVKLPNSVIEICDSAFEGCTKLTTVAFPDSLVTIGTRAFYDCDSLVSVNLPSKVANLGEQAFAECSSLNSVSFKDGIVSIPDKAFYNCASLSGVEFSGTLQTIGERAFYGCKSLGSLSFPEGLKSIGYQAFSKCDALSSVFIPENTSYFGAFDLTTTVSKKNQLSVRAASIDEYFSTLKESVEQLGKTEIAANENVYASANFKVTLFDNQKISFKIFVEAIYDKDDDTENQSSALHVSVFDETGFFNGGDANGEVLGLYYFAADSANVYLNVLGQKIKTPLNGDTSGGLLNFAAKLVGGTLGFDAFETVDFDGFITDLTASFGNDFTARNFLEALIQNLFGSTEDEFEQWLCACFGYPATIGITIENIAKENFFDEKGVTQSEYKDGKVVWQGNIANEILKELAAKTDGIVSETSKLNVAYEILNGVISVISFSGVTAAIGKDNVPVAFSFEVSDFVIKGITAAEQPIATVGDYGTDYVIKKTTTFKVDDNALKITTLNPYETTNLLGVGIKDVCDKYYTQLGSESSEEFYKSLNIDGWTGFEIGGEIVAEFFGTLSVTDRIEVGNAYVEFVYSSGIAKTVLAKAVYCDDLNGGSEIKVIVTDAENEYIKVLKDLAILKIITSLYENNAEKYDAQINTLLRALRDESKTFKMSGLPFNQFFVASIFGMDADNEPTTDYEMRTVSLVDVNKEISKGGYVLTADGYKKIESAVDDGYTVTDENSPYFGLQVKFEKVGENDVIYDYRTLYKEFCESDKKAEFDVKINLKKLLSAILDSVTMSDKKLSLSFNGLLSDFAKYDAKLKALANGILAIGDSEEIGYNYLGVFDTLPIFDKDGNATDYRAAATVEEIYAILLRRQSDIVALTDAGILPAVRVIDYDALTVEKSFGKEIGVDGWCYQSAITLSKAETLVLWKVMSQNSLESADLIAIGLTDETAIESAIEQVTNCYKNGYVYRFISTLGESAFLDSPSNGKQLLNKLFDVPFAIETGFESNGFNVSVRVDGLLTATYNLTIDTNKDAVKAYEDKLTEFNEIFDADLSTVSVSLPYSA